MTMSKHIFYDNALFFFWEKSLEIFNSLISEDFRHENLREGTYSINFSTVWLNSIKTLRRSPFNQNKSNHIWLITIKYAGKI